MSLCDTLQLPKPRQGLKMWVQDGKVEKRRGLLLFLIIFDVVFFGEGGYQGGGWTVKDWEMSEIVMYDVKFPKSQ